MDVKAINFDFYGTLVDWLKIWIETSGMVLRENNLKCSYQDLALEWRKIQRKLPYNKDFILFKENISMALDELSRKYNLQLKN